MCYPALWYESGNKSRSSCTNYNDEALIALPLLILVIYRSIRPQTTRRTTQHKTVKYFPLTKNFGIDNRERKTKELGGTNLSHLYKYYSTKK